MLAAYCPHQLTQIPDHSFGVPTELRLYDRAIDR